LPSAPFRNPLFGLDPQADAVKVHVFKAYLERLRARPSVAHALATGLPLFHAEVARRKAA
jgi:hypothetical protein